MSVDRQFRNKVPGPADSGWLRAGATGGPVWGTSWTDFAAGDEFVVMKRIGNTVKCRGATQRTAGAATVMFTLPVGCRPTRISLRSAWVNGAGVISIATNGDVSVNSAYANTQAIGFDFEFDVDQP